MSKHDWWIAVPIPVEVIKNEDDDYMFKFRFNVGEKITGLDQMIVGHFDPDKAGCSKCGGHLKEVFGESCTVEEN